MIRLVFLQFVFFIVGGGCMFLCMAIGKQLPTWGQALGLTLIFWLVLNIVTEFEGFKND